MPRETLTLERKFERLFGREPDSHRCWFWPGAVMGFANPVIKHDGKVIQVRRVLFEQHVRPLTPGERVYRRCPTVLCVNPHHCSTHHNGAPDEPPLTAEELDEEDCLDLIGGIHPSLWTLDHLQSRQWPTLQRTLERALERALAGEV